MRNYQETIKRHTNPRTGATEETMKKYYYDISFQQSYGALKDCYDTWEEAWENCQEFCGAEGIEPNEKMVFEVN